MVNKKNTDYKSKIANIFGIFMIIFYGGMGFLLIFSNLFNKQLPLVVRLVVGIGFLIYSVFRVIRIIKNRNNDDDDE